MQKSFITSMLCLLACSITAFADDPKLTGTVLGSSPSVDYSTNGQSTTVNQPSAAFDGDLNTYYASYERSNTYVGLDLGSPHVITKVGWSPRNDGNGPKRVQLGVFEGANRADFMDAIPLYINEQTGTIGVISTADVHCSRAVRYVRYVGPNNARCNVAEVQFFGHMAQGDNTELFRPTNLPVVLIRTVNNQKPVQNSKNYVDAYIQIIDEEGHILSDTAGIRYRGNASQDFEKKPYRIKFKSKHHVLDSPAKDKSWTLINNYGDKTLMRNLLAYELSRIFEMSFTAWSRPVDVIINGEYQGCYQLTDQMEVGKNRIDIDKMSAADNSGEALTGGYMWEIDDYAQKEAVWFTSNRGTKVTIHYPKDDSITSAQRDYAKQYFNQMEAAVFASNYSDATNGWRKFMDETTFLKHFLVGEMSGNTDTYWSVYQYKLRNDPKVYTGPCWDFDLAFDNDNRTYHVCSKSDYVYRSGGSCTGAMRSFVDRVIVSDTNTKPALVRIWDDARHNGLTEEHLLAYTDSLAAALEESQRLNFMRWPMLTQWVHMNPQVAGSYAGEVRVVKNYISDRIKWMDRKLGYTYVERPEDYSSLDETQATDGPMRIYNLQGWLIYEGEEMPLLPQGFYIIRRGQTTVKQYISHY